MAIKEFILDPTQQAYLQSIDISDFDKVWNNTSLTTEINSIYSGSIENVYLSSAAYKYWLTRAIVRFDTSFFSDKTIISAKLVAYVGSTSSVKSNGVPVFVKCSFTSNYSTLQDEILNADGTKLREIYNSGNASLTESNPCVHNPYYATTLTDYGAWTDIPIIDLTCINKTGFSYFIVRNIRDYLRSIPTDNTATGTIVLAPSGDLPTYRLKLIVEYVGDSSVLDPPTDITVDGYNYSTNVLTISHSTDSSSLLKGYNLYYKYSTDATYQVLFKNKPSNPYDRTTYLLNRDSNKITQFYIKTVNNSDTEGTASSTINFNPQGLVPSAPLNFTAVPITQDSKTVKITWTAPSDLSSVTSYKVGIYSEKQLDGTDVTNTTNYTITKDKTEYTFTDLTNDRFYSFFINCIFTTNEEGPLAISNYIAISTEPVTTVPPTPVIPEPPVGETTLQLISKDKIIAPPVEFYNHQTPFQLRGQRSLSPRFHNFDIIQKQGNTLLATDYNFGLGLLKINNIEASTHYAMFDAEAKYTTYGDSSGSSEGCYSSEDGERFIYKSNSSCPIGQAAVLDGNLEYVGKVILDRAENWPTNTTAADEFYGTSSFIGGCYKYYIQKRNNRYYVYGITGQSGNLPGTNFIAWDVTDSPQGAGHIDCLYPYMDTTYNPLTDDEKYALNGTSGIQFQPDILESVKIDDTKEYLYYYLNSYQVTFNPLAISKACANIRLIDISNPVGQTNNITTNFSSINLDLSDFGETPIVTVNGVFVSIDYGIAGVSFSKKDANTLKGTLVLSNIDINDYNTINSGASTNYKIIFFDLNVTTGAISNIVKESFNDKYWKISSYSIFERNSNKYFMLVSGDVGWPDTEHKVRLYNINATPTETVTSTLKLTNNEFFTLEQRPRALFVQNGYLYLLFFESRAIRLTKLNLVEQQSVVSIKPTNLQAEQILNYLSILLNWQEPNPTNGDIISYVLSNKTTGEVKTLSPTTFSYTWTGLQFNQNYIFGLKANNAFGYSIEVIANNPPVINTAPPGPPIITNLVVYNHSVNITWDAPLSQGDSAITKYVIKLINNSSTIVDLELDLSSTARTYSFESLVDNTSYYFLISAFNSYGSGPEAISSVFSVTGVVETSRVVYNSLNYIKFFDAPVVLDKNNENYGEYVYPETVTSNVYAIISNPDIDDIVNLGQTNSTFVINLKPLNETSTTYQLSFLLPQEAYTKEDLVSTLKEQAITNGYPISIDLILKTENKEQKAILNLTATTETYEFLPAEENEKLNTAILGENPVIVPYFSEVLVDKHIPTVAYDSSNKRALIDSQQILTSKNVDLIKEGFITVNIENNLHQIILPNKNLRPNKVEIFYFDNHNDYTYLVDHLGDGKLYEKLKNPITQEYYLSPTDGTNYGTIDYETGIISNVKLNNYRASSIIGKGVTYPITVAPTGNYYLVLNKANNIISIQIPAGTYSLRDIINYLNENTLFKDVYKLLASSSGTQLVISTTDTGPFNTLTLTNTNIAGSINPKLLGFGNNPIIIYPPKVYINYSYVFNKPGKEQHIWYQTQHFILKVKNRNIENVFTQDHLRYILSKVNILKPATTVLDGVKVDLSLEDSVTLIDSFSIKPITIAPPYIVVSLPFIDPSSPEYILGSVDITVENPDEQSDTATSSYTFDSTSY